MTNSAGIPQVEITSCTFDIGKVTPHVSASWTYEWILKLLLPTAIKEVVHLVNSEVYKLNPVLNSKLAGLNYNPVLADKFAADLHLVTGPTI